VPPVVKLPAHLGASLDVAPFANPSLDFDLNLRDAAIGGGAAFGLAPVGDLPATLTSSLQQ
jgi:hypothetical protein